MNLEMDLGNFHGILSICNSQCASRQIAFPALGILRTQEKTRQKLI